MANSSKALNKEKSRATDEVDGEGGVTPSERLIMSTADASTAASTEDVHLTENRDN